MIRKKLKTFLYLIIMTMNGGGLWGGGLHKTTQKICQNERREKGWENVMDSRSIEIKRMIE